jgi:hypothetical protein
VPETEDEIRPKLLQPCPLGKTNLARELPLPVAAVCRYGCHTK